MICQNFRNLQETSLCMPVLGLFENSAKLMQQAILKAVQNIQVSVVQVAQITLLETLKIQPFAMKKVMP